MLGNWWPNSSKAKLDAELKGLIDTSLILHFFMICLFEDSLYILYFIPKFFALEGSETLDWQPHLLVSGPLQLPVLFQYIEQICERSV